MFYIVIILIVILDQLTKFFAVNYLQGRVPYIIIDNFLQLSFVKNYGAAFGILQNKQLFFIIITFVILIGIIIFIKRNNNTILMNLALFFIIGGALGNLIDRIRLGYVIDFFDVKFGNFYDYPVFNVADSFIVVGTILIAILVLTNKYENTKE